MVKLVSVHPWFRVSWKVWGGATSKVTTGLLLAEIASSAIGKKNNMQQQLGVVLLSEEELVIETCSVCLWFGVFWGVGTGATRKVLMVCAKRT